MATATATVASTTTVTIPELSDQDYRKLISKPLVRSVDMSAEMSSECMEVITMAVDKHQNTKNYEASAQMIKSSLDKKFGASWHCCIGEGFGFEITYQSKNMIYVYYGTIGILAYKC